MRAAIVTDHARPPRAGDWPEPEPRPGYVEVSPVAVGVHHVVRSLAAGAHYGSGDELPFILGVDGVALLRDGTRVFTGGAPDPLGTMAERTLVPEGFAVPVPDALASERAAALVNPAMSSWMPLAARIDSVRGATVAVLGATGVAGRLAVRFALDRGADRVLAVGRDERMLEALAEDGRVTTVDISGGLDALPGAIADAGPVRAVLDYLWGPVAEAALEGLRRSGMSQHAPHVDHVQLGAVAGRGIHLDAALLRSSNVTLFGSGAGSIDPSVLLHELPLLLDALATIDAPLDLTVAPLAEVERAWGAPGRLVVTMG